MGGTIDAMIAKNVNAVSMAASPGEDGVQPLP
jgi:hypothetical protein